VKDGPGGKSGFTRRKNGQELAGKNKRKSKPKRLPAKHQVEKCKKAARRLPFRNGVRLNDVERAQNWAGQKERNDLQKSIELDRMNDRTEQAGTTLSAHECVQGGDKWSQENSKEQKRPDMLDYGLGRKTNQKPSYHVA